MLRTILFLSALLFLAEARPYRNDECGYPKCKFYNFFFLEKQGTPITNTSCMYFLFLDDYANKVSSAEEMIPGVSYHRFVPVTCHDSNCVYKEASKSCVPKPKPRPRPQTCGFYPC